MPANEYHVNFATGNDTTGDGTSGNPWKTINKALSTGTVAAASGAAIGGMTITMHANATLSGALNLDTPTGLGFNAPLLIQSGDNTRYTIDGGAAAIYSANTADHVHFKSIKFTSTVAGNMVYVDNYCSAYDCIFTGNTSGHAFRGDAACSAIKCSFMNGKGLYFSLDGGHVAFCYFRDRGQTNKFGESADYAIFKTGPGGVVMFNMFDLDAGSGAIGGGVRNLYYGNVFVGGKYVYEDSGPQGSIFMNNIMMDQANTGIKTYSSAGLMSFNNAYFNIPDTIEGTPFLVMEPDSDPAANQPIKNPTGGIWSLHENQIGAGVPREFFDVNGASVHAYNMNRGVPQRRPRLPDATGAMSVGY